MPRVKGEIIIFRPVEEVFNFVADERNEPRYNPRMVRAELITRGDIGPGTKFQAELRKAGRTMPMTVEFTRFERPRQLGPVTRSSVIETDGALTFDAAAGGTRMRWSWEVRPRGLLKLITPLVGVMGGRQERTIWGELKRLLEAREGGP